MFSSLTIFITFVDKFMLLYNILDVQVNKNKVIKRVAWWWVKNVSQLINMLMEIRIRGCCKILHKKRLNCDLFTSSSDRKLHLGIGAEDYDSQFMS